jgi:hypothetical protein
VKQVLYLWAPATCLMLLCVPRDTLAWARKDTKLQPSCRKVHGEHRRSASELSGGFSARQNIVPSKDPAFSGDWAVVQRPISQDPIAGYFGVDSL